MPKKKLAMTATQFSALFEKLKDTAKLTPAKIAEDLGVSRVTLYRWANDSRKIDKFTAAAIKAYAATKLG